jgi:hypothetical protein
MAPLVHTFEDGHPEYRGRIYYETIPPGLLMRQMKAGGRITSGNMTWVAKPDVYLAGLKNVQALIDDGMLTGKPVTYVTNDLTIMVPKDNPAHITSLADLGKPSVRLAMPNPEFEGVVRQIKATLAKSGGDVLVKSVYEDKVASGATILTHIHHRQTPLFLMQGLADAGMTWTSEAIFQEPLAARAQQPTKLPVIGFLGATTPSAQAQWTGALVQRLRDLGWIEGRSVTIEYKWGEGRSEFYPKIVAEFVRSKVDIIVVPGGATLAAKQATSVIPIFFTAATDPVGSGMVASLARPGGNVTGSSIQAPDLVGKRLEFLREVSPSLHRLGIMTDVSYSAAVEEMRELLEITNKLGIEADTLAIRQAEDIAPAFRDLCLSVQWTASLVSGPDFGIRIERQTACHFDAC